jgi:hypothetical protein
MPINENQNHNFSIVALDNFIQATRDSGYKGTQSAIAEIVDNSLQAGATSINIEIRQSEEGNFPLEIAIEDNGKGMDPFTLRQALRFGGSSRFNAREGMGRYGMGLPNSSLSQARRVSVYTWVTLDEVYTSHLDVDEIAEGGVVEVPKPYKVTPPFDLNGRHSGTVVVWSRCDRLDNRRAATISRKLIADIGRRFRFYLWDGVKITVNTVPVAPIDPLFLNQDSKSTGATLFGEELVYEVAESPNNPDNVGIVRVQFSELPVHEWAKLPNNEKRSKGISKGAGASIVRSGREVDYGWFFFGGKRRENYDDWWRCEIRFDPILDEAFGITHTKQQIRPQPHLLEAISEDLEAAARALNSRARKAHMNIKTTERFSQSEKLAEQRDNLLQPMSETPRARDQQVSATLRDRVPSMKAPQKEESEGEMRYKIVQATLRDTSFFNYTQERGRLVLVLNPDHPFFRQIYSPLLDSDTDQSRTMRTQLDLMMLAMARSEALFCEEKEIEVLDRLRQAWSDTLATFLNG